MSSERSLITKTVIAHSLVHICELSFPALAVMVMGELVGKETAYEKIGLAYFFATFFYGAMAVPGGFLADRLGPRKVIWLYLAGSGLAMILIGLSINYFMLCLALALLGGFIGLYHPAGLSLLSLGTRSHGTSMGWHGLGGNLGLAISPLLAGVLGGALGWRAGFILLGLFPLLYSFWVLFDRNLELKNISTPSEPFLNSKNPAGSKFLLLPLIILFLMAVLNGMCYRGLMAFLPAYLFEQIPKGTLPGLSRLAQAGSFTTLILILGMFGQITGGKLADRYSKPWLYTLAFLISAPFLILLSLFSGWSLIFFAMIFAFIYFASQPVGNSLVPEYVGELVRGRIYGWFFFMNFGAGAIMSWLAGIIGDRFSLSKIFLALFLVLIFAGLIGFLLIKVSGKARNKEGT